MAVMTLSAIKFHFCDQPKLPCVLDNVKSPNLGYFKDAGFSFDDEQSFVDEQAGISNSPDMACRHLTDHRRVSACVNLLLTVGW